MKLFILLTFFIVKSEGGVLKDANKTDIVDNLKDYTYSIAGTASEHRADHVRIKTNMQTHKHYQWTNSHKNLVENSDKNSKVVQEIYSEDDDFRSLYLRSLNLKTGKFEEKSLKEKMAVKNRVKREEQDPRCKLFEYDDTKSYITHPYDENDKRELYSNNSDCTTVISIQEGYVIELTFVDKFRIESHPECAYDYLEIRDGKEGYSDLLGKVCGQAFPRVMKTKGPHAWLKFHSDDTIEYEGFKIWVDKKLDPNSC